MKKKLATRNFILIAIALGLGLVFSFISFSVPFSNYIFKGFVNSFNLGLAFSDGVSNTYEVEASNYYSGENALSDAKTIVQDLVSNKYHDGEVNIIDDDKLSITVPDEVIDTTLLLGLVEMKLENSESAQTYVNGAHIKSASYQMTGTNYGVVIEFTKAGKAAFAELTTKAVENAGEAATEGKIYICINKDYANANSLTVPKITEGYASITMSSKEAAKSYADILMNSRFGLYMTTESEAEVTHASFSTAQKVLIAVVVGLIVVGTLVFFAVRYKELGWLTLLAMGIYFVVNVITLCLLDAFRLNMGGIVGMVLAYLITTISIIVLFEKCLAEYKLGKKLPVSFKMGYKKSLQVNADIYAGFGILAVLGLIFANGNLFTLSLGLIFGLVYGALVSMLLMRGFMKMYLYINPTKANKINFKGEAKLNEN